jgi:hypothetical protein
MMISHKAQATTRDKRVLAARRSCQVTGSVVPRAINFRPSLTA